MRAAALVCGLAILLCQSSVLAQTSSSQAAAQKASDSNTKTQQIDSLFSAPFGPIMVAAGPATQGGFGISVSGDKSTPPLSHLYSNLPSTPGPDAWYQAYVTSLQYTVNGLWSTRATSTNNASLSLDPGADLGLYFGHYSPPPKGCKPRKNETGKYTYCVSTMPAARWGFGLHGDAEYRYGTLNQKGQPFNANQALLGMSAYGVRSSLRREPWIVVAPMLTVSYYKPVSTSTSLITLPSNIKSDYLQTEIHVELGSDLFGSMTKVNDQYPLLLDVKYDGSKPLGGIDRGWQSLWRIQFSFNMKSSGIKPAITYQSGAQSGFKFDREVIIGVVAELLNPGK